MKGELGRKTILEIALMIIAIAVILWFFISRFLGENVKDMLPITSKGEVSRFIRYIRCSIAVCTAGCNSGETITLDVTDENGETISCNQLLIGGGCCNEFNSDKLCDKDCVLNFVFKEETIYRGDYKLDKNDPSTYEGTTCSIFKDNGWNTDLSCRGNPSDLYSCPCEICAKVILQKLPYGVLFEYTGVSCGSETGPIVNNFRGSLWLPDSFVTGTHSVTGMENCDVVRGDFNSLKSCTFEEGKQVQIWTDDRKINGVCLWGACVGWPQSNLCPNVVICPT